MACPSVTTGNRFLSEAIAHVECQAQAIGAYGYGALANPGSGVSIALTGLLTIFIAIFGYRLMLGEEMRARGLVGDMLKLGIVLTLATSWPAWRTLGYDVAMKAPGELAGAIAGASRLPGSGNDLVSRMQAADDAIVILTVYGTGRTMGGAVRSDTIGDRLEGIAVTDREGLADGRMAYLAGILAPFALVRLGAGFLLALAPLMAGLLLFAGTRDLFFGWLRGLGSLALGSAALSVLQGVQLAILEPWLRDALALRSAQVLTPSAPTELSVITSVFMMVSFALLFVIAKIFFFGGMGVSGVWQHIQIARDRNASSPRAASFADGERNAQPRALLIAESVSQVLRREERGIGFDRLPGSLALNRPDERTALAGAGGARVETLGEHLRLPEARRYARGSNAGRKRDLK
jgi:type IV secretion system protein VirB6